MVAGSRHLLTVFVGTSILRPKMHQHPYFSIIFLYRYLGQVLYRQEKLKHGLYGSFFRFAKFQVPEKVNIQIKVIIETYFLVQAIFIKNCYCSSHFGHLPKALLSNIVTTTASSSTDSVSLSLSSSMTSAIICPRECLKLHEPLICQILRTQLQTPAC